jgi:DNA (cytosine-5)-methyltransferase 1
MTDTEMVRSDVGVGLRVVSLFCGAGGLDLGFDYAGYDIAYATDMDQACCDTIRANLNFALSSPTIVEKHDIRYLDPVQLPDHIDLIIGGPPCQSFSASGRRAGGAPGRLDERGTLFEAYCRVIAHVQPRAFVFENVRGIMGTNKGEDWRAILDSFARLGYKLSYRILDALDYGVPQQRERMIMVGHRLDTEFLFPEPLFGPDSHNKIPHVTAGQALTHLKDTEDKEPLYLRNGKYSHLLELVPPGSNYLHFTAKRGYSNPIFAYRSRFSDFLYKATPDAPIKTLIARPGKYTGPFHWENRSFTVAEYKRLQGFPDDYRVVGSRDQAIKQIGNSVSPRLAYRLALAISSQIFHRHAQVRLLPTEATLSFDTRKGKKAQITKQYHNRVSNRGDDNRPDMFLCTNYESITTPTSISPEVTNTIVEAQGKTVRITVHADDSQTPFAAMRIEIRPHARGLFDELNAPDATLEVLAFGEADHTVQTMWNAVDDWVIRSSNFHSLFELYGHFTEPHPIFEISRFEKLTKQPIVEFAEHVSMFENCSKYFPREHLARLFGVKFGADNFIDLVKTLRTYRFDIRCHETNITMPEDVYMVAYPFPLPYGKQMNFSVRPQLLRGDRAETTIPKL